MKYKIVGKNIDVTDAIKNVIEDELSTIEKYFINKEIDVNILVRTYNVGQKVEISIRMDKDHLLHQEVASENLYDAIKIAVAKIERQIIKFKNRINDNSQKEKLSSLFVNEDSKAKVNTKVTKRKTFEYKLMTEEEAILQFELIGHDFYIFVDESSEDIKVLYKKHNDEYGIINIENK